VLIDIILYSSSQYNYYFIILKKIYLVFSGNEIFSYDQLIIIRLKLLKHNIITKLVLKNIISLINV
jgi:hypothetical protein